MVSGIIVVIVVVGTAFEDNNGSISVGQSRIAVAWVSPTPVRRIARRVGFEYGGLSANGVRVLHIRVHVKILTLAYSSTM